VVIGAGDLAADMPTSSSQMYARNVHALISDLITDDAIAFDLADVVHAAVVVCHAGQVTSSAVRAALSLGPLALPNPTPDSAPAPDPQKGHAV
jgi:NAD(P) transhydrogenase subunit alpha